MLVSSLVFSIIAISISNVFIQIINIQRRGIAFQKIQDNALFVTESMSRDIRVSSVIDQESPGCVLTTLTMTHPIKGQVVYRVSGGIVEKSEGGGIFNPISTSDVNFTTMNFCVIGSVANDNQTPRIAILTSVQNKTGKETFHVNLQTSVSSRSLRDELQFP